MLLLHPNNAHLILAGVLIIKTRAAMGKWIQEKSVMAITLMVWSVLLEAILTVIVIIALTTSEDVILLLIFVVTVAFSQVSSAIRACLMA
jgi:hypothetical protein